MENYSLILKGILIEGGILEEKLKPCLKNSDNVTATPNCYLQWVLEVSCLCQGRIQWGKLRYLEVKESESQEILRSG